MSLIWMSVCSIVSCLHLVWTGYDKELEITDTDSCMGRRDLMLLLSLVMYSSIQLGFTSGLWCRALALSRCSACSAELCVWHGIWFITLYHGIVARIINSFLLFSLICASFTPYEHEEERLPFQQGYYWRLSPLIGWRGKLKANILVCWLRRKKNGGKVRLCFFFALLFFALNGVFRRKPCGCFEVEKTSRARMHSSTIQTFIRCPETGARETFWSRIRISYGFTWINSKEIEICPHVWGNF